MAGMRDMVMVGNGWCCWLCMVVSLDFILAFDDDDDDDEDDEP